MFHNNAHMIGRSGISRLVLTTAILLFLSVLALTPGMAQEDETEDILSVGTLAPVELDPAIGTNDPEILFNRAIYDYLIETGPDGTISTNLASDFTVSDDGLTYTFDLVEGVTFHDGSPFTSADVVYTYERLQEVESPALGLLGSFTVEAPDESTVVFTLEEPNADFIYGVASRHALILQDGAENVNQIEDGEFSNFNGTGPFILTAFDGNGAVLEANENYWIEGQPMLDGLEFRFIDDPLTQINALRDGEVDFIFKVDVDQIPNIEDIEGINVIDIATNQHPLVRLRADEGSLGENPLIREAFKLATDREELLDSVQEGYGVLGNNNPVGPSYGDFYTELENTGYDPEMACSLIQEATGEERLSTEFFVVDAFNYESLAVALRDQWSEGCIDVDIQLRSEGVYYGDGEWLEVDLGITGWADRPVPQGYLNEAYLEDACCNETHWVDEELISLINEAAVTSDPEARTAIYETIAQIFADRGPVIIPWFASVIGAERDNIEGLQMHPFPGQTDFRTVSFSE